MHNSQPRLDGGSMLYYSLIGSIAICLDASSSPSMVGFPHEARIENPFRFFHDGHATMHSMSATDSNDDVVLGHCQATRRLASLVKQLGRSMALHDPFSNSWVQAGILAAVSRSVKTQRREYLIIAGGHSSFVCE